MEKKKTIDYKIKKPDCCSSQFHLPPCEPETLSAPFYHAVSQTPKPNPGSLKKTDQYCFHWMMKTAQQKQPENDSFMIHCGPKILILYHVISCNANYREVKKSAFGLLLILLLCNSGGDSLTFSTSDITAALIRVATAPPIRRPGYNSRRSLKAGVCSG